MMKDSKDLFGQRGGRAVLLSVQPKYAHAIADGTKCIEFRRRWTSEAVAVLLIYATAPVSRVLGLVHVHEVLEASPSALWRCAKRHGGGVTREELYQYMRGRKTGFGVVLRDFKIFDPPLDPRQVETDFRAPQSFRFMTADELRRYIRVSKRRRSARR